MSRFRRSLILAPVILLLLGAPACTSLPSEDSTSATVPPQERLRVSGSGTCLPLLRILTDEYSSQNPEIEFVYLPGLHSGGGVRGVASGDLELGAVSRSLSDEEAELGLTYLKLSDDGLAVATHPSVEIDGLTSEQVRAIYLGEYDNWSQLGGPDLPMTILDRNEDESAKIILREYVLGPELRVTSKAVNLFYEPDMIEGIECTPGAIGYFSLGFGLSEDVPVNYLHLDGAAPTVDNIEDLSYVMVRPLGVVAAEPLNPVIEAFLEWAQGEEAEELMRSRGFAPVLPAGE